MAIAMPYALSGLSNMLGTCRYGHYGGQSSQVYLGHQMYFLEV